MRDRRWYERFGIEPPFPLLPVAVVVVASVAVGLGGSYLLLMYGGDSILDNLIAAF